MQLARMLSSSSSLLLLLVVVMGILGKTLNEKGDKKFLVSKLLERFGKYKGVFIPWVLSSFGLPSL